MRVDALGSHATVTGAIRQASRLTGTSFQYLLATAQVESGFNPGAASRTSSARGLFQFVEQTWLTTMKEHGAALGYGQYANAITRLPSGKYAVPDPLVHRQIMNMRSDPAANAVMAGAFTKDNAAKLSSRLGRAPTEGELYLAHFLGAAGAGRLISLAEAKPGVQAAQAFPHAARANRSIFYDRAGNARSASDVYRTMVKRYDVARNDPRRSIQGSEVAANTPVSPTAAAAPLSIPVLEPVEATPVAAARAAAARVAAVPDTARINETYAAARPAPQPVRVADATPVFYGLFRSAGDNQPVAPVVSSLWTTPLVEGGPSGAAPPQTPDQATRPQAAPAPAGQTRGPFQNRGTNARELFRRRV